MTINVSRVVFPIRTQPACLLKWNWSTIYFQSGTTASCHRTQKYSIDPDNFNDFHNLPDKVNARKLMLDGKWPGAGCQYCKTIEDAGGISDRIFQVQQLSDSQLVPPELYSDNTAVNISPTILEVYFKNTCNMACVYCGPHFSSRWEDENRKYGSPHDESADAFSITVNQQNVHYKKMVNDLWNFLKINNNAKKIQRYHILGGEPFLLEELDQSIAFWAQYGHPDLQFSIVSNLNIPHTLFQKYLKKFELLADKKKIWRLQLTASLDCWGDEQEYIRYGLDLGLWKKNFNLLLNKPWIYPSINSAISALSIKSLPQLVEQINIWNMNQQDVVEEFRSYSNQILHSFNTTNAVDEVYIFSGDVFKKDFDAVIAAMPEETDTQIGQKQMMAGMASKSSQCKNNIEKIKNLKNYLTKLDQRRGTNWQITFPWLKKIN
jgi:organic radical activating enzyme